ncbi:MAG: 23S rRNA (guanosine(2251)-2'-O)-methyltransferase RlmB [Methylococcales bacterium]|nr:23S rRNA (guanosine(2251)-2'-O)-methyltransferase RlmB [Methylococcales bacterium]
MKASRIFGIHSVQAALEYSPQKIQHAWVDLQRHDARLKQLSSEIQALGIEPELVDRKKLDRLADGKNHQGIVVTVEMPAELTEVDLKDALLYIEGVPLFLVLDHVQDPHNLGACLRSADAAGAHGIIITKDNAVGITPTVCKVASGAAETVPIYQVTNLARTLRWLKEQGLWVIGAADSAPQSLYSVDFNIPLALVVGAEEKGLRRLTQEQCDVLVSLPMLGQVESLNLSVATGVLLYEVVRQRLGVKAV